MSGDVVLVESGSGGVSRLVRAAEAVFSAPDLGAVALVGGLAVTLRLASVHRATNDIDIVSDGDGPRDAVLEYLGDSDLAVSGRIEIHGVTVDVMPTMRLPLEPSGLPDSDLDRLFVLSHRWALDSAGRARLTVVDAAGTTLLDSVELRVATPPALVACKLHALSSRRSARADKRESDALDVLRLVTDLVDAPGTDAAFESGPFDLRQLVAAQASRWFVDDSLRTARLATLGGGPDGTRIDPADVRSLGVRFLGLLGA